MLAISFNRAAKLIALVRLINIKNNLFITGPFINMNHSFLLIAVSEARTNGYVKTIVGRRRYLPDISSSDPSKRAQAERQAINSVVQVTKNRDNIRS